MYDDTWSVSEINHRMSAPIQTHRGLQQGALSSPILFNYFINHLIKQLNDTGIGTDVCGVTISSLFYADDIYLNAKTEHDLTQLLNICTNYANRWNLAFSKDKSRTLSNRKFKKQPR
eukprot:29489_1